MGVHYTCHSLHPLSGPPPYFFFVFIYIFITVKNRRYM
jgi:hypothetical protein